MVVMGILMSYHPVTVDNKKGMDVMKRIIYPLASIGFSMFVWGSTGCVGVEPQPVGNGFIFNYNDTQKFVCSDNGEEAAYQAYNGAPTVDTVNALASIRNQGKGSAGVVIPPITSDDYPVVGSVVLAEYGDNENRVDIVFLGDGYTATNLENENYSDLVSYWQADLFVDDFFASYRSYFNLYRVDIASEDSGIDFYPPTGNSAVFGEYYKNTALDTRFFCNVVTERSLCVSPYKARDFASYAPAADLIVVATNTDRVGGGTVLFADSIVTISSAVGAGTISHELGHSMGKLGDEYLTPNFPWWQGEDIHFVNISDDPADSKWQRWDDLINPLQGALYTSDLYSPTPSSRMRYSSGEAQFDVVGTEQMIIKLYRQVDPIDAATPAGTYARGTVLTVSPMQPIDSTIGVQWWVDGQLDSSNISNAYDTSTLAAGEAHAVAVRVTDNTVKVRFECARAELMRSERIWTIEP